MARVKVDAHKCSDCEGVVKVVIGEKFEMLLSLDEAVSLMQGLGGQLGLPDGSNGKAQHKQEVSHEKC